MSQLVEFQHGPAHGQRRIIEGLPNTIPVHVPDMTSPERCHRTVAYSLSSMFTDDGARVYLCTNPYERDAQRAGAGLGEGEGRDG